jgi:acyl-CoA thioester hydrolase
MSLFKKFAKEVSIRFHDIDAMGHVNNAVYFTYFEEGRKYFLIDVFGTTDIEKISFILAHQRCDYLKPVKLEDRVVVTVWVGEVGRKKFSFKYTLTDRSDASMVYAKGESLMVMYDYKAEKTIEIPVGFLKKILEYQEKPMSQ